MIERWNSYSWKKRNQILWIGTLLFFFVAYQLSIKKTVALRSSLNEQSAAMDKQQVNQEQLARLKVQAAGIAPTDVTRTNCFSQVAKAAEEQQVVLKALPAGSQAAGSSLIMNFDTYQLSGNFHQLVSTLNALEKSADLRLVSTVFRKEKNRESRMEELNLYITLAYASKKETEQ